MKPTIRSLICTATVLAAFCTLMPALQADDATDYANQLYQAQKEREDWQNQREQAQREREDWQRQLDQAQQDRDSMYQAQKERDDWQRQMEQAQKDREDWQNQFYQTLKDRDDWQKQMDQAQKERDDYQNQLTRNDYLQSIQDGIDRVREQRDALLNRGQDAQPEAAVAGAVAAPQPGAPAARPVAALPPGAPPAGVHVLTIINGTSISQQWYYLDERGQVTRSELHAVATPRASASGA